MTEAIRSLKERKQELVDQFSFFEDWTDKYEQIITMGKTLAPMDESLKTDSNLIKGCQSNVWLHARLENGKVYYSADSDAIITKGLVGMFTQLYSGQSPEDILSSDLNFIDEIGLKNHLSPTRANGLLNMVKQIKFYALAFQSKKSKE